MTDIVFHEDKVAKFTSKPSFSLPYININININLKV